MATMIEKKAASIQKEIEKYTTQITRRKALLEKKTAKAIKLDCNWTNEELRANRDTMTQPQWAAWFEMSLAQDSLPDKIKGAARLLFVWKIFLNFVNLLTFS